ncbi:CYTH domain-containing protein [Terasakiella pusilla]|jgi:CYTH domain-containing protein|uniref:CYTH domain-containing protein n=1 Tax=Terasakiella pusilla TaxID=64973 RepID=UPI0006918347|nr:CYTH domain-containing protein [Terasakiella pusilla]
MNNQVEIERKFLVIADGWKNEQTAQKIAQGYISNDKENSSVVRVRTKGEKSFLTIKADRGQIERLEFEYEIPNEDCTLMLEQLCGDAIQKTRYKVEFAGNTWEIDEFHGVNDGLIMAEIELDSPDQPFEKPDWAGPEVSHDSRFFNSYISEHPFSGWGVTQDELVKEFS